MDGSGWTITDGATAMETAAAPADRPHGRRGERERLVRLALDALARSGRAMRMGELEKLGVPTAVMGRLAADGRVRKLGLGVYASLDVPDTGWGDLAVMALRHGSAVACLKTAAAWHGLTTDQPKHFWLAVPRKVAIAPNAVVGSQGACVARWEGARLVEGVETAEVMGVPVRVTGPARTVVDLFAYRRDVGLDVALEALHAFLDQHGTVADVEAVVRRLGDRAGVRTVIEPHLQAATVRRP